MRAFLLCIALAVTLVAEAAPGRFQRLTSGVSRSSRGLPAVPRRTSSLTCIACTCSDSTNYALQSIRFDNAAWTASGQSGGSVPTITVSDGSSTYADPAGGFAAQRIQFSACVAANARSAVLQQTAGGGTGNKVASVYIKSFNGSSTQSISVSLYDTSGNTATTCTTTGDWVRCSGTMNAPIGDTWILIGCNNNSAYTGASNTGAADLLVWQGQLEAGTTPTCPITTTTAAVSRTGACSSVCR